MKVAIVTGISSGIGEAFTASLLDEGYLVFGGSRRESRLSHPNLIDIELDVRDEQSVENFFDEVAEKSEVIDIFVNSAGVCDMSPLKETEPKDFLNNFTTNTYGSFLMLKNLEDFLIAGETKIYNILSTAINEFNEGTLSYAMAENAKAVISKVLKKEWSQYNLEIMDIVLPPVDTPLWDEYENIDREMMIHIDQLKLFFKDLLSMKSGINITQIELSL
jgi:3-oxoacyl-[acyl-carrier protein] reductase